MNRGPLVFLAAFFALAASWFGLVLTPSIQLGRMQQTNMLGSAAVYPLDRPGLAREGAEVYRANGCAYCHSQQVSQRGTGLEVAVVGAGTNTAATLEVIGKLGMAAATAKTLSQMPVTVWKGTDRAAADAVMKQVNATGAKSALAVVPHGPDIERGWGKRRSVAEDYLFDNPVMLGSLRTGPDLANVGIRLPDANWHLRHLYTPRMEVKNSTMPPYRYLFERRKRGKTGSADALALGADAGVAAGYEVAPTHQARALAAYLLSLQANAPLFSSPLSSAVAPVANGDTNAPAGTGTNATTATNAPVK